MNRLLLLLLTILPATQDSAVLKLTVEAGARDRLHAPVRALVQVPARFGDVTRAILEDGSGKTIEGQLATPWPEVVNPPGDTVTRCACGSSGAVGCGAGGVMAWERGRGEAARGRGGR